MQPTKTCARCGEPITGSGYTCAPCRISHARHNEDLRGKSLSFREMQLTHLVHQAKTNKAIAAELGLTEGTVKEYMWRIFRKTGVSNRTELATRAQELLG